MNQDEIITINRWNEFFSNYSRLESYDSKLVNQWHNFFNQYRIHFIPMVRGKKFEATYERTYSFFSNFRSSYTNFFQSGGTIDVCEIMSLKQDEVRNCTVLAWLLNPNGSHGQGNSFFKAFLTCFDCFSEYTESVIENYSVRVEKSYDICTENETEQTSKNRIDIIIENSKFIIFLEVKIYAPEGKEQLKRYTEQLNIIKGKRDTHLVYLTIKGAYPESARNLPMLIHPLSWKKLAKAFEKTLQEVFTQKCMNHIDAPFYALLIQQFCNHIKQF